VFGIWDSTGPKGGLGAKFQRSLVSEIIGVNAQIGKRTGSRIDPLEIYRQAGPIFRTNEECKETEGDWTINPEKAAKNSAGNLILFKKNKEGKDIAWEPETLPDSAVPSVINHGNIPPDFGRYQDNKSGTPDPVSGRDSIVKDSIAPGGVTIDHAEQTIVLSLPALRRLRFPVAGKTTVERDNAGRTVLVALALTAAALAAESGFDLRSRCLLWPTGPLTWELLKTPGQPTEKHMITSEEAIKLLNDAVTAAEKEGLKWHSEPIPLKPAPNMIALLKRSQEIGAKNADTNRE
jgi:CRISPR-associated protein Csb1